MRVNSGLFYEMPIEQSVFHIRPKAKGWCVTTDGQFRPLSLHPTQEDAIALAISLSRRGGSVWLHEIDGTTRELNAPPVPARRAG